MPVHFADILAKEMKQAGAALAPRSDMAVPLPSASSPNRTPQVIRTPDRMHFSGKARLLSASLRQFADDKNRLWQRDSGILTGNANAGYLWKTEEGICGHMSFSTQTGAVVDIRAGGEGEPANDVVVSVRKNGKQFVFEIDDLADPAFSPAPSPFLALESMDSDVQGGVNTSAPPQLLAYNARAKPVNMPGSGLTHTIRAM